MHPLEIGTCGRQRVERHDRVGEPGKAHAVEHGLQALGALGVARPGEVFEIRGMSGEQHGHDPRRYRPRRGSEVPDEAERAATVRAVSSRSSNSTPRRSAVTHAARDRAAGLARQRRVVPRAALVVPAPDCAAGALPPAAAAHAGGPAALDGPPRRAGLHDGAHHCARRTRRRCAPRRLASTPSRSWCCWSTPTRVTAPTRSRQIDATAATDRQPASSRQRHRRRRVRRGVGARSTRDRRRVRGHASLSRSQRRRRRSAPTPSAAATPSKASCSGSLLHPAQQRAGLGRALVLDSLQWIARWRVQRVLGQHAHRQLPRARALRTGLAFAALR